MSEEMNPMIVCVTPHGSLETWVYSIDEDVWICEFCGVSFAIIADINIEGQMQVGQAGSLVYALRMYATPEECGREVLGNL